LDKRQVTFVAQVPESQGFWPADIEIDKVQKPMGRPRKFESVADPKAQPQSAKQWRLQLEARQTKWQELKLPLQQKKSVKVLAVRGRETVDQARTRTSHPGASVIWFDYELGEKEFYSGFVCDDHKVSTRVEKLAQYQTARAVA
jgi:hypothetical protein